MKFECDLKSEVDRQQIFDRRYVVLADTFSTNQGDFVAILDRKFDRLYFVSEHSADEICQMLNNMYLESSSYLGTVSCDVDGYG